MQRTALARLAPSRRENRHSCSCQHQRARTCSSPEEGTIASCRELYSHAARHLRTRSGPVCHSSGPRPLCGHCTQLRKHMDPASEQKLDVATMIIQLQKMLPQTVSWGAQAEQQLAVTHTHLARSRRRVPDAPEPAAGWTDGPCRRRVGSCSSHRHVRDRKIWKVNREEACSARISEPVARCWTGETSHQPAALQPVNKQQR